MKLSRKLEQIRKERIAKRHYQPFVSVIVLAYNQKELLRLSLKALFRQDYPKDKYEIIITDDGSSDGTRTIVSKIMKKPSIPLKYCFQEDKGFRAAKARNIGAKHAKGEVLIFLDADAIADVYLITQHVKSQSKYDVVCGYAAGHRAEKQLKLSSIMTIIEKETIHLKNLGNLEEGREHIFSTQNTSKKNIIWQYFHSNNFSIKAKLFNQFKFDERFVGWGEEDIEFAYRLFKTGKSFFFNKRCYSIHYEKRKPNMLLNYTPQKVESQINNMSLFYRIHKNQDIRQYIIRRFTQLPDPLLTKEYNISKVLGIDKAKNRELLKKSFTTNKTKLAAYPTRLYVELTKKCNMHCKMCGLRNFLGDSQHEEMDFNLFKRIAYEFFPYADFVDIRGLGESLLYSRIEEVIELCKKFDCNFGLLTNLAVKNYRLLETILKNNFWIGISIDGANKGVYGKIRGKGYFNQVLMNIRFIMRKSKQHNYDLNRLYFLVTVQKDNFNSLPSFVGLAKQLGIRKIELNPVVSKDPDINLTTVEEKTKKKIEEIILLAKKEGIKIILTGMFFEQDYVKLLTKKYNLECLPSYSYIGYEGYKFHRNCSKGYSHLFIAQDGKIGPCNHAMNLLLLGEITNSKPFMGEWNNEDFISFRKKLNSKERPQPCKNCINRQYPINFS